MKTYLILFIFLFLSKEFLLINDDLLLIGIFLVSIALINTLLDNFLFASVEELKKEIKEMLINNFNNRMSFFKEYKDVNFNFSSFDLFSSLINSLENNIYLKWAL